MTTALDIIRCRPLAGMPSMLFPKAFEMLSMISKENTATFLGENGG
jgi:hypothetical protein